MQARDVEMKNAGCREAGEVGARLWSELDQSCYGIAASISTGSEMY
jgi:hypothetical protein